MHLLRRRSTPIDAGRPPHGRPRSALAADGALQLPGAGLPGDLVVIAGGAPGRRRPLGSTGAAHQSGWTPRRWRSPAAGCAHTTCRSRSRLGPLIVPSLAISVTTYLRQPSDSSRASYDADGCPTSGTRARPP